MNFLPSMISEPWLWVSHAVFTTCVVLCLYYLPWRWFKQHYNVFFAFVVVLMILWTIRAGIKPGFEYHYLGATLFTLLFGWQLAIIGMSLVMLGNILAGLSYWQSLSFNLLLMAVLPVMSSWFFYVQMTRRLPHHYFIYVFVGAFFNAAIAIALSVFSASLLLVAGHTYSLDVVMYEYTPYISLMVYPEAFLTGLLIIIMSIYFPDQVYTFNDQFFTLSR